MATHCVVLPHECADGAANMAFDEAMLDAVAADPTRAYFRTYGWTTPTLSLGYFQRLAEADIDPRWRLVPKVRRLTGGGALWHHHEITYALVLSREHTLARDSKALYRAVHEAIASELRSEGIEAARRGNDGAEGIDEPRPFLCFTGYDAEDIVSRGAKLVGSAQRRRAGAVLQHGALLLARSPLTPALAGANNLTPQPREDGYWRERLERRVPAALGFLPTLGAPDLRLVERAVELERSVYRCSAWNNRR
ncbi:MAG: lipoate--protein ligase [Isosphaeraceae bacterium]|nr:lipoate--protein ligase [Isosphaeraceae bacterium]